MDECLKFALKANATHGLRRSPSDKLSALSMAVKRWPELSTSALADMCYLSRRFVEANRPKSKSPPPPRAKPSVPTEKDCGTPETEGDPDDQPKVASAPPSASPPPRRTGSDGVSRPVPAPKEQLDKLGFPIPLPIIESWNNAEETKFYINTISVMRGKIQAAQDAKNISFAEVNFSSVKSNLDQAYADLKVTVPYAVCPTCQGKNTRNCASCKGRGFVSEFYWNTCVTQEAKTMRGKANKK